MRTMSYSCPICGNTGRTLETDDGFCTCPFGKEMAWSWRDRRIRASAPAPLPSDLDNVHYRRPRIDPRSKRPRNGMILPGARNEIVRPM